MGMWSIPKEGDPGRFSSEELDRFVDRLADAIVRRHLSVPAVLFIEMGKPLSFVGASAVQFFAPLIDVWIDPDRVEKLGVVLGDRARVESLLVAIETKTAAADAGAVADAAAGTGAAATPSGPATAGDEPGGAGGARGAGQPEG